VAELRRRIPPASLLQGATIPSPAESLQSSREINGTELPEKVLILSFDDGPHRVYTEEIKAILQKEQVPALFFEVGRNLGTQDTSGQIKLGPLAVLTQDLAKNGFVVGNHSYTHAQLSKETGAPLDLEIRETDLLLRAIPGAHSQLFRFPYGARTAMQLQALETYHLRSVLWNIDSLDWADPVPSSVADRVLKAIGREKRGIILFHDIHDRAGKVLPILIPKLRAEGYRFAGLDGEGGLVEPSR
jgi:peptidoglycan/xylan/chitin deacetylase (PgdA/CDA1 family)